MVSEQDEERWKTLSADRDRLRDVDQQNSELKVKLARAEARNRALEAELAAAQELIRSLESAPTFAGAFLDRPSGISNGKVPK